jgi:hypothetical protein
VRESLAASAILAASLIWVAALIVDPTPLGSVAASLLSVGLLANSTVSMVGMIASGGRWAHRLGFGVAAVTIAIALLRPLDPVWGVGLAATMVAILALASPTLTRTIRQLPSATGPPPRVVAVPLLTLGAPCLLGLTGAEATTWALLLVGLTGPVAAFMYSRVVPGGLLAVRVVWPALALAASPLLGPLGAIVSISMAVAVAALAWHPSVKSSYHPPVEKGSAFPIPPELVPGEILDAADIDESGRPL